MSRGALLVSAVIAGPAYADPCLDDHPAGTAANVVLRGRLAAEKTLTADTLRAAVAAGRDAKVTCKSSGKTKVRCTVKYANRKARLTRNGRVYARGTASALTVRRKLTRGRYTLRVGSQSFLIRL